MQRGLGVGFGLYQAVGQVGIQAAVVVDLPVAHDPGCEVGVGQRLLPTGHVHNGQPLVAKPRRVVQRHDAGVVRPTVLDPIQHPLALVGVDRPVGVRVTGHDAAHSGTLLAF